MPAQNETIRYVDRPDIIETFVDSIGRGQFHERVGRIELCVTRLDEAKPGNQITGRRYPVVRAVLTPQAIVDLFQQLQGMMFALQKEGIITVQEPPKPPTGKPN